MNEDVGELISVIVPIYNVEDYLIACIESLISQSYQNMEIILVDDGSTDSSGEIADDYEEKDDRIKVIHKRNGGLSSARNIGIEMAHGDYIFLLDSDDLLHNKAIEMLYKTLKSTNSDISIASTKVFFDSDKYDLKKEISMNYSIYTGRECNLSEYHDEINSTDMTVAWGKLYKRNLFNNINYPVGRLHEDEFVTYKLLDMSELCCYLKDELYFYRKRTGSITFQKKEKNYLDTLIAFRERRDYFHNKNKKEEEGLATLRLLFELTFYWEYLKIKKTMPDIRRKQRNIVSEYRAIFIKSIWRYDCTIRARIKLFVFFFSPIIHHLCV